MARHEIGDIGRRRFTSIEKFDERQEAMIWWSLLTYDPREGGYVIPLDKQALADAPYYDVDEIRKLGGPTHPRYGRIVDYYGAYGTPLI